MLQIGSTQSIVFNKDDASPMYLIEVERISKRYDKNTIVIKKEKRKLAELIEALKVERSITAKDNLKKLLTYV